MAPTYTTQNDYDYLLNAQDWRERIRVRLQMLFRAFKPVGDGITYDDPRAYENFIESILSGLDELNNDFQNTYKKKAVRSNLVGRGALYTYLIDKDLPQDLNSEHKKEIEAVFFASYIRLLLLEYYEQNPESVHQYKQERDDFRMRLKAEYTNVVVEISDAIEFIYLYRFERAIRKLYEITHKIEIKLSLKVGNLLEGCADNKRYIIGGRSAKDTMRRLNLIEHLIIEYLPEDTIARKRKEKKSNSSSNIEPNTLDFTGELSSYLAGGGSLPNEDVLPGKRKYASSDNLEYLESALAGSNNGAGSGGGGGMLFDVGNFFLEVENNPNSFFRNFELLEHNWKLLLELGYGKELDDLYQPPPQLTRKQRQSSATKLKFLQPKLTTSSDLGVYKNKKEYVLDHDGVPSHRAIVGTSGENRKNVPSAYEYAKNLVLGSFHLLKIFPMETKLPKYYEDQIKNESVILSLLQDESRHSNIIRLLDWNFPRISSIPSSVMLSLASLPSTSSSFISNKSSLHTPATFMNMMKKKALLEEEKNEDKMNYFIFEFMDDFFPDFYQMHILSSAPVSPNGDGRVLVGGEDGRVLTIIRDMLAAVKSLHDRHMIHRDLSMDKFMVKCCGGDRIVAKLVNLSSVVVLPQSSDYDYYVKNVSSCLSHVEEGSKYPYHQFPTNIDYAAPELHHLKSSSSSSVELFTPAMDCWPLGVIFKYLCTGSLSHISSTEWKGKSQEEWTAANEAALYHLPKNLSSMIQGLLQLSPQTRSSLANAEKILFDM